MKVTSPFIQRLRLDQQYGLLNARSAQMVGELFKLLDTHERNGLDDVQFRAFFYTSTDLPKKQITKIFEIFDLDRSGSVEFGEVLSSSDKFKTDIAIKDNKAKQFLYRHWRTCFELLDEDGSKSVSREEFETLGFLFNFSRSAVKKIFQVFDVSGNSELDIDEFQLFVFAAIDMQADIERRENRKTERKLRKLEIEAQKEAEKDTLEAKYAGDKRLKGAGSSWTGWITDIKTFINSLFRPSLNKIREDSNIAIEQQILSTNEMPADLSDNTQADHPEKSKPGISPSYKRMTKPLKQTKLTSFFAKKTESPSTPRDKAEEFATPHPKKYTEPKSLDAEREITISQLDLVAETPLAKRSASQLDSNLSSNSRVKKRMVVLSDDEADENFELGTEDEKRDKSLSKSSNAVNSTPISAQKFAFTPKATGKTTPSASYTKTPLNFNLTPLVRTGEDRKKERQEKFQAKNEEKYAFLLDIRDAEGRKSDHPEYDKRTLFVPQSFWKAATPFERQYWEIKCQHYDTVVFFKKGKFFELFEKDADLGARLFDLKLTDRGHMRMVGVPESSFGFWAGKFIAQGYKVAKVDQLETSIGKEMRERDTSSSSRKASEKEDCIVRRELSSVLTGGTLVDADLLTGDQGTYCLAVKETLLLDSVDQGTVRIGACFVDTSTAEFYCCSFNDDSDRSVLSTLLVQTQPKEILFERGQISQKSMKVLKDSVPLNTMWNSLKARSEFWDIYTCKEEIKAAKYFDNGNCQSQFPQQLSSLQDDDEAMSAFGAIIWYLRSLKLDVDLLTQSKLNLYDPIKQSGSLILDGQTLVNLEVFKTVDERERGSLFHLLNRASTPFGKRLFKRWVCHPLTNIDAIETRLNVVEQLMAVPDHSDMFRKKILKLPDIERSLSRIHSGTCKLKELLGVLQGFETIENAAQILKPVVKNAKSSRLQFILDQLSREEIIQNVEAVKSCFNIQKARADGEFVINAGVEEDYDAVIKETTIIEQELEEHLKEQRKVLKCSDIKYKDLGKEIFQIEVPSKALENVPSSWLKRSATKACSRYHSPYLVKKTREYQEAMEKKTVILDQLYLRVLKRMDKLSSVFRETISLLSELDCYLCLASVSTFLSDILNGQTCRPQFISWSDAGNAPYLELETLRHPCIVANNSDGFVSNDLMMNEAVGSSILLTGPNMGGKSTLLRQTCIAIIMAQIGCYVPASTCKMTIFDRIFTRIGANDNIMAGQSTFMVELSETSRILHQATSKSLVILDELGRGTSSLDGYAIAFSVLTQLVKKIQCLTLFATHYGLLATEFEKVHSVRMMNMACRVDTSERDVVFLYKLIDGVSPKSYGMNVAHMAGVPLSVVERAEEKAMKMENENGWIGCVGRANAQKTSFLDSSNLLVQFDYQTLLELSNKLKLGEQLNEDEKKWLQHAWKSSRAMS